MKAITILFLCISIAGGYHRASAGDDLEVWHERASKTKAGMSLTEAEDLFPAYTPPAADHDQSLAYFPFTFSWGAHQTRLRWVASDIAVWIDYETAPAVHPLTGPVIVERRVPHTLALGSFSAPLSTSAFTLRSTISRDADSVSPLLR